MAYLNNSRFKRKLLSSTFRSLKSLENKQCKIIETCEMVQIFAGRIQKEAEGKWKKAQESRCDRSELEKKLCAAEGNK